MQNLNSLSNSTKSGGRSNSQISSSANSVFTRRVNKEWIIFVKSFTFSWVHTLCRAYTGWICYATTLTYRCTIGQRLRPGTLASAWSTWEVERDSNKPNISHLYSHCRRTVWYWISPESIRVFKSDETLNFLNRIFEIGFLNWIFPIKILKLNFQIEVSKFEFQINFFQNEFLKLRLSKSFFKNDLCQTNFWN